MIDVDLSNNLLVDWVEVAKLVQALPHLRALTLSHNCLQPFPPSPPSLAAAFSNLRALVLNAVPSAWNSALHLASTGHFPLLAELHLAHNSISTLHDAAGVRGDASDLWGAVLARSFPALTTLDLSHNHLSDWGAVCALQQLPHLQHLILNGNHLSAVVYPDAAPSSSPTPFAPLSTLSLSDNCLSSFTSLSALARFPSLTSLSIQRNPSLDQLASTPALLRLHAISRIPQLRLLNSSTIQRRERSDSEKFYMAYAEEQWRAEGGGGKGGGKSVGQMFERYEELRRKHGMGVEEAQGGGGQGVKGEGREDVGAGTLGRSTAEVQLRLYDRQGQVVGSGSKRLLLTMKVSALRAVMDRQFKLTPAERGRFSMQAKQEEVSHPCHYPHSPPRLSLELLTKCPLSLLCARAVEWCVGGDGRCAEAAVVLRPPTGQHRGAEANRLALRAVREAPSTAAIAASSPAAGGPLLHCGTHGVHRRRSSPRYLRKAPASELAPSTHSIALTLPPSSPTVVGVSCGRDRFVVPSPGASLNGQFGIEQCGRQQADSRKQVGAIVVHMRRTIHPTRAQSLAGADHNSQAIHTRSGSTFVQRCMRRGCGARSGGRGGVKMLLPVSLSPEALHNELLVATRTARRQYSESEHREAAEG